jgi:acyl-coenzyme A synthetase/AMP-(fatty) acid ligase/acyl carrier protein
MKLYAEYVATRPAARPEKLRLAMMSGDWIPLSLPGKIRAVAPGIELISLGGATEASIWSILYPIGEMNPSWKSVPYGRAMVNQTFHVLDSALNPCPLWAPGQLYIGGTGLAKGYWRDAQKTEASFITHPRTGELLYRTGDLGRLMPDGNIEFLGREDFQVKIQGFRIELEEIEAALRQHQALQDAIVAAQGGHGTEKRLVAGVVPRNGSVPSPAELRDFLLTKLPKYMVPSAFTVIPRLPLSANGKIDRSALPAIEEESGGAKVAAASGGSIDRIGQIVKGILNIGTIDPADNLLCLGATSLNMIGIINALDTDLHFRPKISELYRTPTVEGLAKAFEESRRQSSPAPAADAAELLERIKNMAPDQIKEMLAATKL